MKVFADSKRDNEMEGGFHMPPEHRGPRGHMPPPPHERKALMQIEFCAEDWALLQQIFGDEDSALATAKTIAGAPPEIQILAIQLMNMIKEVD